MVGLGEAVRLPDGARPDVSATTGSLFMLADVSSDPRHQSSFSKSAGGMRNENKAHIKSQKWTVFHRNQKEREEKTRERKSKLKERRGNMTKKAFNSLSNAFYFLFRAIISERNLGL